MKFIKLMFFISEFSGEKLCFQSKILQENLTTVLGENLNEKLLQYCLSSLKIWQPAAAKQLWQATGAKPGIYIVLSGKVRLLDSFDNLITTIAPGKSFWRTDFISRREFSTLRG